MAPKLAPGTERDEVTARLPSLESRRSRGLCGQSRSCEWNGRCDWSWRGWSGAFGRGRLAPAPPPRQWQTGHACLAVFSCLLFHQPSALISHTFDLVRRGVSVRRSRLQLGTWRIANLPKLGEACATSLVHNPRQVRCRIAALGHGETNSPRALLIGGPSDRMSFPEEATHPRCYGEGYPDRPGRASKQGGRVVDHHSEAL